MAETLIDSYSEANYGHTSSLQDNHPTAAKVFSALGQSFTCGGAYKLTSCKFYLNKANNPTGMAHAVLYAHSGAYGSSSLPTGEPLATSDDFDVEDIVAGSYALYSLSFSGAEQYLMSADTYYCIVFEAPAVGTIDSTNRPQVGEDSTSPTHGGNGIVWYNGAWGTSGYDRIFYVYGEIVGVEHTHSASDTLAMSDSLSPALTMNVALDDTLSIGDALTAELIEGAVRRRKRGLPYGFKPARVYKVGRIGV